MPVSRTRKRNKRNKNTRNKPKTKHQERPKKDRPHIKLEMLYSVGFQIALGILFVVFLSFGIYFLKDRTDLAIWLFFFAVVSAALALTFLIQARLLYEPETSGLLRPAR